VSKSSKILLRFLGISLPALEGSPRDFKLKVVNKDFEAFSSESEMVPQLIAREKLPMGLKRRSCICQAEAGAILDRWCIPNFFDCDGGAVREQEK
jgi:hypothetical protein